MDITEEELKALEEQYKTAVNIADKPEEEKSAAEDLEEFSIYNEETKQIDTLYSTYENIEENYIYCDNLDCLVLKENIVKVIYLSNSLLDSEDLQDYVTQTGWDLEILNNDFSYSSIRIHKKDINSFHYIKELDFYYVIDDYEEEQLIYNPLDKLIYINYQHLINNGFERDSNNKIIKYVPKELNLSEIQNYEIIKSCLDDFYKDRWDIIPINVTDYKKDLNIVIFYPEVNITNSRNEKHTIKELYVIIPIHLDSNNFVFSGNLYGFRTFQTADEYGSNYIHSHLSCAKILQIGKFCLGSGDINLTIRNLMNKSNFSEILFKGFLLTLEYYITWESLEGGPHRKLETLFSKSQEINSNPTSYNTFNVYDPKLFTKIFSKITPIYLNGLIDYNLKDLENCLTEYYNTQTHTNRDLVISWNWLVNYDSDNNKYYKISTSSTITKDILETSNITFRGSKLLGFVKVGINTENQNIKRVANPQCTNYVRKRFIERIGNSFFESKRDQEIRKTYSID